MKKSLLIPIRLHNQANFQGLKPQTEMEMQPTKGEQLAINLENIAHFRNNKPQSPMSFVQHTDLTLTKPKKKKVSDFIDL